MRWFVAFLILIGTISGADALPLRGGGASCLPPTTDGASYLAPTSCTVIAAGHTWTVGGLHNGTGPGYDIDADGSFFAVGDAIGRSNAIFYFRATFATCGTIWQRYISSAANAFTTGFGGADLLDFTDTTTSTNYGSWSALLNSASANDTLTIQPISATYGNCWPLEANQFKSGQTVNLASGFYQTAGLDIGGNSINATGVSIIGNSGTPAVFNQELRVRDGSTTPLFEYVQVKSLSSAPCGGGPGTGILTGDDGVVTLLHAQVNGCGAGGGGQDHNVYVSAPATNSTTAATVITDLISLNVVNGGWTLKMRPPGTNTQNHVTQSMLGCTLSGAGNPGCEQNGAVDMPCVGNYKIDFSTIERGPGGDNFYLFRTGEENRDNSQCATAWAPTNSIEIAHNNLIWDGAGHGTTNPFLLCLGGSGTPTCNSVSPTGFAASVHDNVIVDDDSQGAAGTLLPGAGLSIGCTFSSGKCTDSSNNRWYNNRTTAAANEGWSGNDQFGNPCCAFPYLPAHL